MRSVDDLCREYFSAQFDLPIDAAVYVRAIISCKSRKARVSAVFLALPYVVTTRAGIGSTALSQLPSNHIERIDTVNSPFAKTVFIASFYVVSLAAHAQYGSSSPPVDKSAATGSATAKRMSESDIRAYRDGRSACGKMTGSAKDDCRKQLSAKYVDKQCGKLTGEKLDECLKTEYPGD